jgi:hypothetical protein
VADFRFIVADFRRLLLAGFAGAPVCKTSAPTGPAAAQGAVSTELRGFNYRAPSRRWAKIPRARNASPPTNALVAQACS